MAKLSDIIENFIKTVIDETDGVAEIQRNELATYFNCVPSQISYVISTRFTSNNGYYTESTRGGGGKIVIRRIDYDQPQECYLHYLSTIGDRISQQDANILICNMFDYKMITKKEGKIIKAAVNQKSYDGVEPENVDTLRASILKNIILSLIVC